MLRCRLPVLVGIVFVLATSSSAAWAQSFAPVGNLDCNGFSQIQQLLKTRQFCANFRDAYDERGYDNGDYIGHDEPGIGFISTAPRSGDNVQWEFTSPRERPLPATQSFENLISLLKTSSLSGCRWHSAIRDLTRKARVSPTAIRTLLALPGLRSSNCNSFFPAFLPTFLKSAAI